MACRVAPCMPLQMFRSRSASQARRARVQQLTSKLTEDLDTLGADQSHGNLTQSQEAAFAEDARKRLQLAREVFEEYCKSEMDTRSAPVDGAGELLVQFLAADLPARLVTSLSKLDFEARKDVINIFKTLLRIDAPPSVRDQFVTYIVGHPRFQLILLEGYATPEMALHSGMLLRTCAGHERLAEAFLTSGEVPALIRYAKNDSFDISSDALCTLRDLLFAYKDSSAAYLEAHFQEFFGLFNGLLQVEHYITQRQALKFLSDMLLDRCFMRVMMAYVGDDQFLQIHMNLLRDNSKAIQLEAFHIFKIFVANPQKPPRVNQILYRNRGKLVKHLETLKANTSEDVQFVKDRGTVIDKLQSLQDTPKTVSRKSSKETFIDEPFGCASGELDSPTAVAAVA